MKKLICFILTAALTLTPATMAFAKQGDSDRQNQNSKYQQQENEQNKEQNKEQNVTAKEKKQSFKINGGSVIKYGKYKLPIAPITKGIGATVSFDKTTAVLTVIKDTKTIVIDFKNKTVTVNGVAETNSGIFTAKNDKKSTVLIKYIAAVLGVRVNIGKDKITVIVPAEDTTAPTVTSVLSAAYAASGSAVSVSGSSITIKITGGSAKGDKVDVTKLSLYDTTLAKTYQLTNAAGTGSVGFVTDETTLTITLGSADILGLSGFGSSTVVLSIAPGSLLYDAAGNTSTAFTAVQSVPVTVIK